MLPWTRQSLAQRLRHPDRRLGARVDRRTLPHGRVGVAGVDYDTQSGRRGLVKFRREAIDCLRREIVDESDDAQAANRLQFTVDMYYQ